MRPLPNLYVRRAVLMTYEAQYTPAAEVIARRWEAGPVWVAAQWRCVD